MSDLSTGSHFASITFTFTSITSFSLERLMNQQAAASQKSHAEQETENEANRLKEQVEAALAIVPLRSPDEVDSLNVAADRIERAARDLADALRQLAKQRQSADDE
ncbi:MAG TPA: hypothetical protein VFS77_19170 [Pyrinomonadaceae bacterium]|nr:hypothetical protein [Pyrinomonadaceae bacterium]